MPTAVRTAAIALLSLTATGCVSKAVVRAEAGYAVKQADAAQTKLDECLSGFRKLCLAENSTLPCPANDPQKARSPCGSCVDVAIACEEVKLLIQKVEASNEALRLRAH